MNRTFTAILHKEGQIYVAECPETGTASQGSNIEEAIRNLQEATEVYLEEFPMGETQRPLVTTFEVAVRGSTPSSFRAGGDSSLPAPWVPPGATEG